MSCSMMGRLPDGRSQRNPRRDRVLLPAMKAPRIYEAATRTRPARTDVPTRNTSPRSCPGKSPHKKHLGLRCVHGCRVPSSQVARGFQLPPARILTEHHRASGQRRVPHCDVSNIVLLTLPKRAESTSHRAAAAGHPPGPTGPVPIGDRIVGPPAGDAPRWAVAA